MSEATSSHKPEHDKPIDITVNKKKVTMTEPTVKGLQIKEAAVAQGVQIQLDFELKQLLDGGDRLIIGDNDVVNIDKHSKFVATASDDNS